VAAALAPVVAAAAVEAGEAESLPGAAALEEAAPAAAFSSHNLPARP
jgi:hypothetical protein